MEDAEKYLAIWNVYFNPEDFPGVYVARKFLIKEEAVPTNVVVTATTLQGVRDQLPWGLILMPRAPSDPAACVESWF
jgi:hypothetical protein